MENVLPFKSFEFCENSDLLEQQQKKSFQENLKNASLPRIAWNA